MNNTGQPAGALKYRADIDGLRALAVIPVVFYHAGFAWFSGGFVGVDVFFVISGYLITSILLNEISAGDFSFKKFYERRARRLFPALFAVIGVACVAAPFLLMPAELEDFGQSVAATALFVSNFLFFSEAGYFAGPAELKPLLHTWSLAIEEQYYLLFPGYLLVISKYAGARYLPWVAGLFVVSFGISVISVYQAPDAAFYLLPSRTWELMIGSLLALGGWQVAHRVLRELGAWLGLLLILTAVFGLSASTAFPGMAALLPCVGTALVILCGQGGRASTVSRLLSWRPVVFFGLISYSLYLWHWPLLVFAKHYVVRPLQPAEALTLVALAVVLAIGSWRFIERPFRQRSGWMNRRGVFRFSAAFMVVIIAVGLFYDHTRGLPARLPGSVARVAEVALEKPAHRKRCEGIEAADIDMQRLCRVNVLQVEPSFLLWGDSHAMMSMTAVGEAAARTGRNGVIAATNGCAPLLNVYRAGRGGADCGAVNDAVLEMIAAKPELGIVLLVARWARHAEGTPYGNESGATLYLTDTKRVASGASENRLLFAEALRQTVQALVGLERQVVLLGAIPEVGEEVPNHLAKMKWRGRTYELLLPYVQFVQRQAAVQQAMAAVQQQAGVRFYPVAPYLCSGISCALVSGDGMPLYFDDNHLSRIGLQRVQPLFDEMFQSLTPALKN